ncbi:hypothetical protein EUGRSUZ_C00019 [Eucalyptus grandis]|uniref:Uncharacterized protein n=2 Tax=Eucalyptus grandis TaxID=71139 RepID=A0ACC3LBF5_EUCGR|nr:hypothetical protein EUGRSUZ_C00019 [Eucalyptus grandis]
MMVSIDTIRLECKSSQSAQPLQTLCRNFSLTFEAFSIINDKISPIQHENAAHQLDSSPKVYISIESITYV